MTAGLISAGLASAPANVVAKSGLEAERRLDQPVRWSRRGVIGAGIAAAGP